MDNYKSYEEIKQDIAKTQHPLDVKIRKSVQDKQLYYYTSHVLADAMSRRDKTPYEVSADIIREMTYVIADTKDEMLRMKCDLEDIYDKLCEVFTDYTGYDATDYIDAFL